MAKMKRKNGIRRIIFLEVKLSLKWNRNLSLCKCSHNQYQDKYLQNICQEHLFANPKLFLPITFGVSTAFGFEFIARKSKKLCTSIPGEIQHISRIFVLGNKLHYVK